MDSINNKVYSHHPNEEINRVSAEEMDERRNQNIAYEYLCRLEEAKKYPYIINKTQIYSLFYLNKMD